MKVKSYLPTLKGGAYFGWYSCPICAHCRRGMFAQYPLVGPSQPAWLANKKWQERIYKEMWDDYVNTNISNMKDSTNG